jgi:hypothetical protein
MMTSATMTIGGMTMTDMEQENPSPLLIHMRAQNAKLREQIAAEVADMRGMDLQAVLREIRKLKGRGND